MTDSLLVVLDDAVAGTVTRLRGGRLRFDYDDRYRETHTATPLSLAMPMQLRSHSDGVVRPWLWGLLPDNDAVLRSWARQFHVSASSPFSLLATPIGQDCPGAVRFLDADSAARIEDRGEIVWLSDEDVAVRLRELRADATAWLGRSFTGQFSLAGAQAKTALLLRDGCWGVPSGSTPTTHILKPAVVGLDDHDLNEHLCLQAAQHVGLLAVHTRVARFAGETSVVVTRYDRRFGEGRVLRVHQEDLCQALGVHPSRKYQNEGGPGPTDIADLLRAAMPHDAAEEAVWRFADALIWNWLIAGTDAHAKNYSLLISGPNVRLAPLYDVASALPYGTHERKLRFAMKVGGDCRVHLHRNPWPAAARELNLDVDKLTARARTFAGNVADAFADAARDAEVASLNRPLPTRLVDLVADRASRCRRILDGGPASSVDG